MPITEGSFDPIALHLFFSAIVERQRVYWRRLEGKPPPWTNDPILRSEFITNVYRELDPGTTHLIDNIIAFEEESFEDRLLNVIIYRLLGSREEVQTELGFWRCSEWDEAEVLRTLLEMNQSGRQVFGEAYRTASYSDMGSKSKLENVTRLFSLMVPTLPDVASELRNAINLRSCFEILNNVHGLGEFLAYQIMVDLLYPAPVEPLLPFNQDSWALAGPGARKGIWRLLQPGLKPSNLLEVMQWLRDNQRNMFQKFNLEMPYLLDDDGHEIEISLCNIQSCLCEFQKYARIWDGKVRAVRKYNYTERLMSVVEEPSVTLLAPAAGVEGVGNIVVDTSGPLLTGSGQHGGLVRTTVASGEFLQGASAQQVVVDSGSVQPPLENTGEFDDPTVLEADSVSQVFYDQHGRPVPLDAVENAVRNGANSGVQRISGSSLDVVPSHSVASQHYDAAGRNARVYTNDGEVVHVTVHSSKRVKNLTIEFD